jgi:NADPH-dependent glutamate synthase beta subunit-like oxidoreductase
MKLNVIIKFNYLNSKRIPFYMSKKNINKKQISKPIKKVKYDVCVIGSGPAGFAAAMRSYDFGNHVVL